VFEGRGSDSDLPKPKCLPITGMELRLIAAAASIGERSNPKNCPKKAPG
jgi:hypothetical protein